MSFRQRLTLWYTVLLFTMLLFFGVALYFTVRYSYYNEAQNLLQVRAQAVADWSRFRAAEGEQIIMEGRDTSGEDVRIQPPPINVDPSVYIEVRQVNGTLSHRSDNLETRELPWQEATLSAVRAGQTQIVEQAWLDEPILLRTEPIYYKEQLWSIVQVAAPLDGILADLQRLALYIASGIMATLALAVLLGAWIAERALGPVDAVTQAALKISRAEDLGRRLPNYHNNDELGRLIDAFNEMLERLDVVFRDQQRFVADVSHELRTPLTALMGNIHLLKRGMIDDPKQRMETLNTLENEVARLTRLATDLLTLARADGGEKIVPRPVELDTILLEVYRYARVLVQTHDSPVKVRFGDIDQAIVLGDPDRLKQLFINLVDNAIKYTQEGEVSISMDKNEVKGTVTVTVQDTGIGIPKEFLPNLFKRFYRTDKARSRAAGGTGLGLAIVEWIVAGHNAEISVESEEGQGSTFTVTFALPSMNDLATAKANTGTQRAIPAIPIAR